MNCAHGDVVFVSAAGGAVGSSAGQFARLLGASRVIGSAGGPDKARLLVDELGFDEGIDYRADLVGGWPPRRRKVSTCTSTMSAVII